MRLLRVVRTIPKQKNLVAIKRKQILNLKKNRAAIKKSTTVASTNPDEAQTTHSTSQMSYDQRTNNMDLLISLLQNTTNYNPNEVEYQITTYQAKKAEMLVKTQAVANAFIPLNNARSTRNATLYNNDENLVDIANKAKDYLFTILDANSSQYKAIAKIKFKKR